MDEPVPPPPPSRPRHRAVLVHCALLFILGVSLQVSYFIVLAGALLLLLTLGYAYAAITLRHAHCGRKVYHGAFEGEPVRVRLEIGNRGRLPIFLPEVVDLFAPDRTPHQEAFAPVRLDPGKLCYRHYTGKCFRRRGTYTLGPMTLRVSDPLGLFFLEKRVDARQEFYVYPGTFPIPDFPQVGQKAVFSTGYDVIPRSGQSQLYMGTREYRRGDEMRTVDWRATARFGRMIVKEYETDVEPEATIFLDLDAAHAQGMGQRSTLEAGVKIAASLALKIVQSRAYLQFVALGSRYHYLPFGAGEGHLIRLLDLLVHVKQDGATPFGDFLTFARDLVRPGSTVFLVITSTEFDPVKCAPAFVNFRSRRARVYAVLLDDASFLQWKEQLDPRAAKEQRDRAIGTLEQEGCTVILVDAERPLDEAFRAMPTPDEPTAHTGADLEARIGANREAGL